MGSATGIYISKQTVTLAGLAGSVRSPRLRSFLVQPREGEDGALATPLAERDRPQKKTIVALPAEMVSTRRLTLPLTDPEKIAGTLKFQAERLFPGITPEEIAVDFLILDKGKDFTEILLFVVQLEQVTNHLQPLTELGIKPEIITIDALAIFNLVAAGGLLAGKTGALIINFTPTSIQLLLTRDGRLHTLRQLPLGAPAQLASRLIREIKLTRIAAGLTTPTELVVLTGNLPPRPVLDRLESDLACPVTLFNPLATIQAGGLDEAAAELKESPWAAAAALAGLGRTAVPLNFLRTDYRYRTTYETLRPAVLLTLVMLVAWIGLELLAAMSAATTVNAHYDRLQKQAKRLYLQVIPKNRPKFSSTTFDKTLEGIARLRENNETGGREWQSYLDFMKALTRHLPVDDKTVIHMINYKGKKATIRGEADDVNSFEEIARNLEEAGKFTVRAPVRKRTARRSGPRKPLSFTIELSPRSK